jgi:hypothetical protein
MRRRSNGGRLVQRWMSVFSAAVVACAMVDSCGDAAPGGIPSDPPGPLCMNAYQSQGDCWGCLAGSSRDLFASTACDGFWKCFCVCPSSDPTVPTACAQTCESTMDAACARWWSQVTHNAVHCDSCQPYCSGTTLPVSMSALSAVEARLGGAAMFASTACSSGAGDASAVPDGRLIDATKTGETGGVAAMDVATERTEGAGGEH